MNRLSQEIVDLIVSFLCEPREELEWEGLGRAAALYATIDRKFQRAVERHSFESLNISNERLAAFTQILNPRRQGLVKELKYQGIFPIVPAMLDYRIETRYETEAVSAIFSRYMRDLFDALSSMDGLWGVRLYLQDFYHRQSENDDDCFYFFDKAAGRRLAAHRHLRTRICLVEPLPRLSCISRLTFGRWKRMPSPTVQVAIARCLTGLHTLEMVMDGSEARFPGLLRRQRHELARRLLSHYRGRRWISEATLDLSLVCRVTNQMISLPNLVSPQEYDLLGASVRVWSRKLTRFCVKGAFDETLFWPHSSETETHVTQWPNLKFFDVFLERHTPSGWWYFMPEDEPNYGTSPRNPMNDRNDFLPVNYFAD